MPCWPQVHPISSPWFLISLFIKLNIEDYKGNQWYWSDTLKYFSNCDTCVSLLTTKSSIGSNNYHNFKVVMSISQSIQSFSCVRLFVTPWTAAYQASLSFPISWSLLKLMSIKSVMPSNHLILCHPLLLPPSIFPSIRVFSNESVLGIFLVVQGLSFTFQCRGYRFDAWSGI